MHTLTKHLTQAFCACGWYTVLITTAQRDALTVCPKAAQR